MAEDKDGTQVKDEIINVFDVDLGEMYLFKTTESLKGDIIKAYSGSVVDMRGRYDAHGGMNRADAASEISSCIVFKVNDTLGTDHEPDELEFIEPYELDLTTWL